MKSAVNWLIRCLYPMLTFLLHHECPSHDQMIFYRVLTIDRPYSLYQINNVSESVNTAPASIISSSALKRAAAGRPVVSPHLPNTSTSTTTEQLTVVCAHCSITASDPAKRNTTFISEWRHQSRMEAVGHQVQAPVSQRVAASCLPESRDSSHTIPTHYEKAVILEEQNTEKQNNVSLFTLTHTSTTQCLGPSPTTIVVLLLLPSDKPMRALDTQYSLTSSRDASLMAAGRIRFHADSFFLHDL